MTAMNRQGAINNLETLIEAHGDQQDWTALEFIKVFMQFQQDRIDLFVKIITAIKEQVKDHG